MAYAAAAASYLTSAGLYGDTTIDAALANDLTQIAYLLETQHFTIPATEYSGELYFHLRTLAAGLRALSLNTDGEKVDKLADSYGRSILTAHYTALPAIVVSPADAGAPPPVDAGAGRDAALPDAAGTHEAGPGGAGSNLPNGIIGNPSGSNQIAYATADVATAAYALLDLVNRNQTDTSVGAWLSAARASLNHVRARAIEPTTGMFYTALVVDKGGDAGASDVLAPSTTAGVPSDALLADTQATFALAMARAQFLVTSNHERPMTSAAPRDEAAECFCCRGERAVRPC